MQEDELYLEGLKAVHKRSYQEAQEKLETLLKQSSGNRRAEIILGCLLIRRECEKLIQTTDK